MPDFISKMLENKWLGIKSGQGFYKKDGKKINVLDLKLLNIKIKRVRFETLEQTKSIENIIDRFKILVNGKDKG